MGRGRGPAGGQGSMLVEGGGRGRAVGDCGEGGRLALRMALVFMALAGTASAYFWWGAAYYFRRSV